MPFALLKSRPCMDRCEPWLSSNKRTGFSLEHLVCLTKCFKNSRKCDSFIHSDGLADPELPGGAHLRKLSRKCTLGKIKKGGTTLPVAETATAIVTRLSLSPEVIWHCANLPHIYWANLPHVRGKLTHIRG